MPKKTKHWGTGRYTSSVDGVIIQKIFTQAHEPGRIYTCNIQPSRDLILEENKSLRNEPGAIRDLSFGRWIAQIPVDDLNDWRTKYPEMRGELGSKAYQLKLMELIRASGDKYLVQPREKVFTKRQKSVAELHGVT